MNGLDWSLWILLAVCIGFCGLGAWAWMKAFETLREAQKLLNATEKLQEVMEGLK